MPSPRDVADVMKDVDYYEAQPEGFDTYSWSPTPEAKVTQVHLHVVLNAFRIVTRFKGPGTLDRLINALIEHREEVWGKRP